MTSLDYSPDNKLTIAWLIYDVVFCTHYDRSSINDYLSYILTE